MIDQGASMVTKSPKDPLHSSSSSVYKSPLSVLTASSKDSQTTSSPLFPSPDDENSIVDSVSSGPTSPVEKTTTIPIAATTSTTTTARRLKRRPSSLAPPFHLSQPQPDAASLSSNASSRGPPSTSSHPWPRTIHLPAAPHELRASVLAESLPIDQLAGLVMALSREKQRMEVHVASLEREMVALETVAMEGGVGKGECERARLRARVESESNAKPSKKTEWKFDLDPNDGPTNDETPNLLSNAAASDEIDLNLDDLAEAISDNTFDFTTSPRIDARSVKSMNDLDDNSATNSKDASNPPELPEATHSFSTIRPRHASLSARIMNSLSLAVETPPYPSSSSSTSNNSPLPASESQSPSSIPIPNGSKKAKRRQYRSDSLKSTSSILSRGSSVASSEVSEAKKEQGYGAWMGWKTWSRGATKDKDVENMKSRLSSSATEEVGDSPRDGSASSSVDSPTVAGVEKVDPSESSPTSPAARDVTDIFGTDSEMPLSPNIEIVHTPHTQSPIIKPLSDSEAPQEGAFVFNEDVIATPRPSTRSFSSPSTQVSDVEENVIDFRERRLSNIIDNKSNGTSPGLGDTAPASLSMNRSSSGSTRRTSASQEPNLTLFPKLSSLSKYSPFAEPALSTPSTHVSLSTQSLSSANPHAHSPSIKSAPITMELDTIIGTAPPTLSDLGGVTTRGLGESNLSDGIDEEPLVDRYGFVYDVRSGMNLLREARKKKDKPKQDPISGAGTGLLATDEPTSEVPTTEDSSSTHLDLVEGALLASNDVEVHAELEALREALGLPHSASVSPTFPRSPDPRHSSSNGQNVTEIDSTSSGLKDGQASKSVPPTPSSAKLIRSVSLQNNNSNNNNSSLNPQAGPQSMKRLLNQLTEIHDTAEKQRKDGWDSFIKRRQAKLAKQHPIHKDSELNQNRRERAAARNVGELSGLINDVRWQDEAVVDDGWNSENLVGVAQMGNAGKSGKEDWTEFKDLVRKGVSIAYRPKIWAECSGANEASEPGVYQELLIKHAGEVNQCLAQIDMDCHRTFPTNVYFAGTGPGVTKLRNVLVAYSWRNPKIGYCQGMNNLTATLLLTYASEEEAFWVLVCIIEKILPSDYYTSHLLVSQADQRVLLDLTQRQLPAVADHLQELGVELPAVTFGWFLSLFTDALPIQTLLRVWDLLFVFGTVILFRIAVGIIQLNATEILGCDSAANLYALMRTATTHLYQVDRLLKVACEDLRPVVKDRDISLLRNKHVIELQFELGITPEEPSQGESVD